MDNKNTQKADDNSNQVQVGTALFIGITEERARAIIKEESAPIIEAYNEVAREIAQIRSEKFENLFIPTLVKAELLESLKKPEIILAIQEAERQAICTDEEKSYELLSRLLLNRIEYSNDKAMALNIKYATEVAIEVTDEALLGLTTFLLIVRYLPTSIMIKKGLNILNNMFGKIDLDKLPTDKMWIEQLEMLKLARINPIGSLKKTIEYYSENLDGYLCVGIKKGTDNYNEAVNLLEKANLTKDVLITHELNEEYVRLPIVAVGDFSKVCQNNVTNEDAEKYLSSEQKKAYEMIIKLYEQNDTVLNANKNRFIEMLSQFPNLVKVKDWWDQINMYFLPTMVGIVLACANIDINYDIPKQELKDLLYNNVIT